MTILNHLYERFLDPNGYSGIHLDLLGFRATFLLWNLSGQIVGYQTYSPLLQKGGGSETPKNQKYFTHVTSESENTKKIAVWGLETFNYRSDCLFITEGIFDACRLHRFNIPAIAVLSCDPKQIKSWIKTLNRNIIVIADSGEGGSKLLKYGDYKIQIENGDLGNLHDVEIHSILCQINLGLFNIENNSTKN